MRDCIFRFYFSIFGSDKCKVKSENATCLKAQLEQQKSLSNAIQSIFSPILATLATWERLLIAIKCHGNSCAGVQKFLFKKSGKSTEIQKNYSKLKKLENQLKYKNSYSKKKRVENQPKYKNSYSKLKSGKSTEIRNCQQRTKI